MNLVFLLPAALAALAALLLPLLLHLVRRTERKPVDFAAWRALVARVRPRRQVRFDDWPLLLVRLLLLALLALLLARPALVGDAPAQPWIVATPGVPAESLREATVEAGAGDDIERRWLAPGFSALDQPAPDAPQPVASLLRELDATLPADASLTVLVPPLLEGADAGRLQLSRTVDWRVVDMPAATTGPAAALPVPKLDLRHPPDRADAARYLRAAATSWSAPSGDTRANDAANSTSLEAPLPKYDVVLAWLVPGPLPDRVRDWIAGGGTALLDAATTLPGDDPGTPRLRDADGRPVLDAVAVEDRLAYRFSAPLAPAAMPALLDPAFASGLRAVLQPPPAPARVDARTYAPSAGAATWPAAPRELAAWLLLAIALLFVVERWMAAGPRRQVDA